MAQCPKCGTRLQDGARSCSACGWSISLGGVTRVATADEKAEILGAIAGPLVMTGTDALFEALKKELVAEYDLERELGRGGMAVVYKAVEKDLFRAVALKVLPPGHGGADIAERFRREARMAAALDHPNIIPVYRVGQAAGTFFFAMKYVEGRAVDAIVESQGALPVPVIVQILRSSTSALAFAHERGIVHRDIKGANILVDRDGRVMVSDFGIARATEDKALTASGSVMGTPHFMSPEQCAGQKVGPQSDQYSLGVLAFQMLTGSVPFDADSLIAILQHHFFTPVPDVNLVREGVPPELIAIMTRALAKSPAARYPSTKDMLADLERIPLGDAQRSAADETLKRLAVGEAVPKVRTGSLPPLPDARLARASAEAATVPAITAVPGGLPKIEPGERSRMPLVLGGVAALALVAAGIALLVSRNDARGLRVASDSVARAESLRVSFDDSLRQARRLAAADSVAGQAGDSARAAAPPAATPAPVVVAAPRRSESQKRAPVRQPAAQAAPTRAAPAPAGSTTLSLRTVPTNADVTLDGRPLQQGGVIGFAIGAGRHTLLVHASNCQDYRTTIDAQDGVPVNLRTVTLQCNQ